MGAGTLIELIARGKQDTYIIGNPQFSFFKSVYRRYTNFAIEPIRQIFTETPDFNKRVTCIIDKKADLLSDILLEINLPALQNGVSWTNSIGYFMIDWIELQLGGEQIDRISGDLLDTWMELTTQLGIKNSVYNMIGKIISFNNNSQTGALSLLLPIPFWFCRSIERALPLISMQYTDVKIIVQFKSFDQCWYKLTTQTPSSELNIISASLICSYVYLDVFERTKFAKQDTFEYLIEQFQMSNLYNISDSIMNYTARVFFNHPVKEIFWMYRSDVALNANDYYNYASISQYNTPFLKSKEPFDTIQIRYNGNDRFEQLPEKYFRLYQPYKYHSCGTLQYIYMYSFAINPESMQPSGTCNFSKIDNATFNFSFTSNIPDGKIMIYATNYNILKIMNGMAGLLFSS